MRFSKAENYMLKQILVPIYIMYVFRNVFSVAEKVHAAVVNDDQVETSTHGIDLRNEKKSHSQRLLTSFFICVRNASKSAEKFIFSRTVL